MSSNSSILVVGAGNLFRSDDAAGILVVQKLSDLVDESVEIREGIGDGTDLLDLWKDFDFVFTIDTVCSGGDTGRIYRFDAINDRLPAEMFSGVSTHTFNLAEAVELAGNLDMLPNSLVIYGIEGRLFDNGQVISGEVRDSIDLVAEKVKKEIDDILTRIKERKNA